MPPFLKAIAEQVLVMDGGMGTMLMQHGLRSGQCPEELNRSHPEVVARVHRAYAEAGADILLTNSFGGNRVRLAQFRLQDQLAELNRLAVEIARSSAPEDVFIGASVGPTGRFGLSGADVNPEETIAIFREQIAALAAAGPDFIAFETFYDLSELRAAISACREVCDVPIMAQMTFGVDGCSILGTSPAEAAIALDELQVDIIGSNCGQGMVGLYDVLMEMRKVCARPLVAQPNAGLPVTGVAGLVYPEAPHELVAYFDRLVALGVRVIGGCCGTTPAHIAALRAKADLLVD